MKHYDVDEEFANVQNADIDEIEVERPTLIGYIVDKSCSMYEHEYEMQSAFDLVKDAIEGSKESDEMRVSITQFGNDVKTTGYQSIEDIDVSYQADGGYTRLFDAIVGEQKSLYAGDGSGYMEKLRANGNRPKAVVFIFTDGQDNASSYLKSDARKAIEFLHKNEIAVGFIEFGSQAYGVAEEIGIFKQNIKSISASASELRKIMMATSKSAISASKSANVSATDSLFDF